MACLRERRVSTERRRARDIVNIVHSSSSGMQPVPGIRRFHSFAFMFNIAYPIYYILHTRIYMSLSLSLSRSSWKFRDNIKHVKFRQPISPSVA